jgi:hypothetical protein
MYVITCNLKGFFIWNSEIQTDRTAAEALAVPAEKGAESGMTVL